MRLTTFPSPSNPMWKLSWPVPWIRPVLVPMRVRWLQWARMEVRPEFIWYGVIAILLALYAWFLFTGTVTRRH